MAGEEIALTVARQAVENGMNKLSPKNKSIVVSSIQAIFGVTLCVIAAKQFYKLFIEKQQADVANG